MARSATTLFLHHIAQMLRIMSLANLSDPRSTALKLFERRVACAAAGGVFHAIISILPTILIGVSIDRAMLSHSAEGLVIIAVLAVAGTILAMSMNYAGQQYLHSAWMTASASFHRRADEPSRAALIRIDRMVEAGAAWRALCLTSIPLFAGLLAAQSWWILLLGVVIALSAALAEWIAMRAVAATLVAVSGVMASVVSSWLIMTGDITVGGLVVASMATVRLTQLFVVACREWPALMEMRRVYLLLRAAPGSDQIASDVTWNREAVRHATSVVLINSAIALALFMAAATQISNTIVLDGRAVGEGYARQIRSAAASIVAEVRAQNGDRVEAGAVLISFDSREAARMLVDVRDQISATKTAIEAVDRDRSIRLGLLNRQVTSFRALVAKNVKPESDLISAEMRLAEFDSSNALQKTKLLVDISAAHSRAAELERMDRQALMTAPVSGTVEDVIGLGPGQAVTPDQILMTVVPDSVAFIEARLDPAQRGQIDTGQAVMLRIRTGDVAHSEPVSGRVAKISADVSSAKDLDGGYRVTVQSDSAVPTGSRVEILIDSGSKSGLSWLADVVANLWRRAQV